MYFIYCGAEIASIGQYTRRRTTAKRCRVVGEIRKGGLPIEELHQRKRTDLMCTETNMTKHISQY